MAASLVFDVVCSAERADNENVRIAELELPAGKEQIGPDDILKGWRPVDERYSVVDRSGEPRKGHNSKAPLIRDGVQLVCPRCFNPVLITEPGGTRGLYLAPGNFGTGEA